MFCQNMINVQAQFLASNQALLATGGSPAAGVGANLFTFMANRLSMSFTNLDCQNFGLANPVTVTLDGDGAAIAAYSAAPPRSGSRTRATGECPPGSAGAAPTTGS